MILIITPNPAIDHILRLDRLMPHQVQRSLDEQFSAGGKGVNAARTIQALGGQVLCMGFLGGASGRMLAELAAAEGLAADWTQVAGNTRSALILLEPDAGPTVINPPGPVLNAADWAHLATRVKAQAVHARWICFNGSLPAGSQLQAYRGLIQDLRQAGKCVWVDAAGAVLQAALEAAPHGVKINAEEAAALQGQRVETIPQALAAARSILAQGAAVAVITLGAQGAVWADVQGAGKVLPPPIQVLSSVGSGDSFLGGLLVALDTGKPLAEALRWGAAAGAANALTATAGKIVREDFQRLLEKSTVETISE